jgi:iron(III) transport system permease protein
VGPIAGSRALVANVPTLGAAVPAGLRNLRRRDIYHNVVLLIVFTAIATPLVFLILGSFSASQLPGKYALSDFTVANYVNTWLVPETYELFVNTFVFVAGSTAMGLVIAAILAWLVERTDMPGKIWVYVGVPITIAMPGMLQAMAWVLLLSPRIGFLNQWLKDVLHLESMPFDIYTMTGMVFVEGLRLVPTAFLMLVPLLRSMDPALEEAAATCGAPPASTIRKVTSRMLAPGLFAVMIYQAMTALEIFEVPGIIGLPAGIHVFSTKIYSIVSSVSFLPAYGEANALGMLYLFIAVIATVFYARIIARSERYATVTGKGYRPRLFRLGIWWRSLAVLFIALIFTASVAAPFAVFVYISLLPYLEQPTLVSSSLFTLANYRQLFQSAIIGKVVWNTIILVVVTSTATAVFSLMISLVVVRSKFWGRRLLDQLAFVPHAIPGLVLSLAFFWCFLRIDSAGVPIYGGIISISITLTVIFMSYGTRVMNAAILQIHKDLEEAANVNGATPWRVTRYILIPLLVPAIAGVWLWSFLHAVRVAGVPLMLSDSSDNEVLAVLMWHMWDQGYIPAVGTLGTLLMLVMAALTLMVNKLGLKRRTQVQG